MSERPYDIEALTLDLNNQGWTGTLTYNPEGPTLIARQTVRAEWFDHHHELTIAQVDRLFCHVRTVTIYRPDNHVFPQNGVQLMTEPFRSALECVWRLDAALKDQS